MPLSIRFNGTDEKAGLVSTVPLKRLGKPEEIARFEPEPVTVAQISHYLLTVREYRCPCCKGTSWGDNPAPSWTTRSARRPRASSDHPSEE